MAPLSTIGQGGALICVKGPRVNGFLTFEVDKVNEALTVKKTSFRGKVMRAPSCSPYLLRRLRWLREVCLAIHRGELPPCAPCAYREICRAMEAKREAGPGHPSIRHLRSYLKDELH